MQQPIKLGPLALLLTVITICLTTLAILTLTTARADLRLAEKYAERFRWPEIFTRTQDGHVVWIRLEPGGQPRIIC